MASSMEHLLRQQKRVIFNQVFGTETNFKVDWGSEEIKNGLLFEKYKYQFILRISEASASWKDLSLQKSIDTQKSISLFKTLY